MKHSLQGLLVFLVFLFSPVVRSEESIPSIQKIGVVNLARVFEGFEETKSSESELEKITKQKQGERDRIVSEIKTMREELLLLNENSREERQKQIEQKMQNLASFDQDAKGTLFKKRDESVKQILDRIEGVVTSYAKQQGYELILSDRAVLYGVDAVDITDEILAILNSQKGGKKAS